MEVDNTLLQALIRVSGAKRVLEIGTFTCGEGWVLDPKDESDKAIAALNDYDYVTNDTRVNNVLLTLRDGLMLAFRA